MLSNKASYVLMRNSKWQAVYALAFAMLLFLAPSQALGQAQIHEASTALPDFDARSGSVTPT